MKKNSPGFLFAGLIAATFLLACNSEERSTTENDGSKSENGSASDDEQLIEERLRRFDSLDFQFYSSQKWDSFSISHADNIKVIYPDGHVTTGLYPQHIDMLTPLFAFAPDTKITSHPVKFGSGDWTAVIGEMEGTFSKPMDLGNGKVIQPTNKKFKMTMSTIARWKDGKMVEEYLHWDNQTMMKQIGLAE